MISLNGARGILQRTSLELSDRVDGLYSGLGFLQKRLDESEFLGDVAPLVSLENCGVVRLPYQRQ
jgi:hypothetical protein